MKIKLYLFDNMLKVRSFFGLPGMTKIDRGVIKQALLDASRGKPYIRVFEWGSGISTKYFTNFLYKQGIRFDWYAVDNDRAWYEKVEKMCRYDDVHLFVREFENLPRIGKQRPPRLKEEIEYIKLPEDLGLKFDFMFVDGRYRRRCMEVARRCLTKDGIVVCHDANRLHYNLRGTMPVEEIIESGKYYPIDKYHHQIYVGRNGK